MGDWIDDSQRAAIAPPNESRDATAPAAANPRLNGKRFFSLPVESFAWAETS